jgi:hypothetical protein
MGAGSHAIMLTPEGPNKYGLQCFSQCSSRLQAQRNSAAAGALLGAYLSRQPNLVPAPRRSTGWPPRCAHGRSQPWSGTAPAQGMDQSTEAGVLLLERRSAAFAIEVAAKLGAIVLTPQRNMGVQYCLSP